MRRSVPILLVVGVALAASGCESTQDQAARVQKANALRTKIAAQPLRIPRSDSRIRVTSKVLLKGKDVNAVVVTLKNTSSKSIADIPIAVNVRNRSGRLVATNTAPGSDHWLNHVPLIRAGQTVDWIDDQFDPDTTAASASVKVGIGAVVNRPYADARLFRTSFFEDPVSGTSLAGKAKSSAPVTQERLVVFSVGRSGGRVVSAGRGVVERLAGGKASGFTVFFVGANPKSVALKTIAPPVLSPKK